MVFSSQLCPGDLPQRLSVEGNSLTINHRRLRSLGLQPLHRTVHSWVFSLPGFRDASYPLRLDHHLLLFLKLTL